MRLGDVAQLHGRESLGQSSKGSSDMESLQMQGCA